MSDIHIALIKAFSKSNSAGNPAGVVLDADALTDTKMQRMAAELGFSESAFVSKSEVADFRVRFFSPKEEVGFCGHATIATFHALAEAGKINAAGKSSVTLTQQTNIGILPVTYHADGRIDMTQTEPTFGDIEDDRDQIANLLGIGQSSLLDYPIQVVSTGTPKLMIPVNSLATLRAITPDLEGVAAYCRAGEARGFYAFTSETINPEANFYARQFNPAVGIDEDPITGIAAGALGCYAKQYGLVGSEQLVIEQGYGMGKGGQMFVDLHGGVKVGGYAVTFGNKTLDINNGH